MCADSTGGFFGGVDWGTLSNITSILGVLVIGPSILVLQWLFKKESKAREAKRARQTKQITDIATEVTKPLQKEVTNIGNTLGKYTEQNESIIENLEKINARLDEFRNNQIEIRTKVNYLDRVFQNNMRFTHHDDDQDDSPPPPPPPPPKRGRGR